MWPHALPTFAQSPGSRLYTPEPVNASHPLLNSCAAWWRSIDGVTTSPWLDIVNNGKATLTGMASLTTGFRGPPAPGGDGKSILGNGASAYGTGPLGNALIPSTTITATVAAWARPNATSMATDRRIINFVKVGAVSVLSILVGRAANKFSAFGRDGGSALVQVDSNVTYTADAWHWVVATVTGTTLTLYVDGMSVGSATVNVANTIGSMDVVGVGLLAFPGGTSAVFGGNADDLMILRRGWAPAEVAASYDLARRGWPGILNRTPGIEYSFPSSGRITSTVPPAPSQRIDAPQDSNGEWYLLRPCRVPVATVLLLPPLLNQDRPYIYDLPDLTSTYTLANKALPVTLGTPLGRSPSQRQEALPNLNQEWQTYAPVRFPLATLLLLPPVLGSHSQATYVLPELGWQYDVRPLLPRSTSQPQAPSTQQPSQRYDALPNLSQEWQAYSRMQPVPITYLPLPPVLRQASQGMHTLPVVEGAYQPKTLNVPVPAAFSGQMPSQATYTLPVTEGTYQPKTLSAPIPISKLGQLPSQRYDGLPSLSQEWQANQRRWPVPVQYLPTPPPTHAPEQHQEALPDYTYLWYQQVRLQPPMGFTIPTPLQITWSGLTNLKLIWQGDTNLGLVWEGRA